MSADTLEAATPIDQGSASQGEMEIEAIHKGPETHVAASPANVHDRKINSDKLGKRIKGQWKRAVQKWGHQECN